VDADDRLRLDYEQTTQLYRALVDIRFKLLAVVPAVSGIAVGFFAQRPPAEALLSLGTLGLLATSGVILYELRNTQLHAAVLRRAQELEQRLALPALLGGREHGGAYSERPAPMVKLFGVVDATHRHALALVYGTSFGAWAYLVVWGVLLSLEITGARAVALVVGAALAVATVAYVDRLEGRRGDRWAG